MSRMKTFLKYLIILVLFYVFSNIMIDAFLKVSYTDMSGYNINVTQLYVDVTEAKSSNRNGYINGIVKNNTNVVVENKYLEINMLSEKGNILGVKYIQIDRIEPNQLRKFEVKFDYDNVKTFNIELTDSVPEEIDFWDLVKNNAHNWISMDVN